VLLIETVDAYGKEKEGDKEDRASGMLFVRVHIKGVSEERRMSERVGE
jgi:hypothetical protein